MVLENPVLPFYEWLAGGLYSALPMFVWTLLVLALGSIVVGLLVSIILYGPSRGGERVYRVVRNGLAEMFHWSPRRVFAIARLAVQESLRRRVLVAIVVFVVLLLFASWFLKADRDPGKLYFSFVLTATAYMGVFIGLLLSVFSLPNDFKTKTIYTIVTKPVRAGDIVLGRILGFTMVGTALLAIMGVTSYIFVWRSLDHVHEIDTSTTKEITDPDGVVIAQIPAFTKPARDGHRHEIMVEDDGGLVAAFAQGHEHQVLQDGGEYLISPPLSTMRARVPKMGRLYFYDENGSRKQRGVSVGKEWKYRSFIQGGSQAAAVWTFDGIDESTLRSGEGDGDQYLPIELIVRVFRTYKADIEKAVRGSIQLRNPETLLKSQVNFFLARDDYIDSHYFPRKLTDADNNPIDLIDDLVSSKGEIEVIVQCIDRAQYYGFAQADCYLRRPDDSPLMNFFKALISVWVQMVIVISIAVTSSTLLSGPIALLFTVSFILLGFQKEFFMSIAQKTLEGGGPLEALVRLVTHMNMTSPFPNEAERIEIYLLKQVDGVFQKCMVALANVLPDFGQFNGASYVASGFSIPWNLVVQQLLVCLAFVVGATVIGYFFLRNREIAK